MKKVLLSRLKILVIDDVTSLVQINFLWTFNYVWTTVAAQGINKSIFYMHSDNQLTVNADGLKMVLTYYESFLNNCSREI